MKLFHYCSAEHVSQIKKEGLTKGKLTLLGRNGMPKAFLEPIQWLTQNPKWNQSWDTGMTLPYSRTDYKIIIDIPPEKADTDLYKWWDGMWHHLKNQSDFIESREVDLKTTFKTLNQFGDPDNWYCYWGVIPKEWFRQIIKNPNS